MREYAKVKLVKSGDIYDFFFFKIPILLGSSGRPKKKSLKTISAKRKKENREKSGMRSRSALRRLINANAYQYLRQNGQPHRPIFLTLTFRENITELTMAHYEFMKFILRLKFSLMLESIKYVAVVEFQKRGAIHYHVLFFNLPKLGKDIHAQFDKLWGHGFIFLKSVDDVNNIGAYVSKYMGKNLEDTRLRGRKSYFSSRSLKKPETMYDALTIKEFFKTLPPFQKTLDKVYDSVYCGKIRHIQFNTRQSE